MTHIKIASSEEFVNILENWSNKHEYPQDIFYTMPYGFMIKNGECYMIGIEDMPLEVRIDLIKQIVK